MENEGKEKNGGTQIKKKKKEKRERRAKYEGMEIDEAR